jgi:hypothetical protein
MILLLALLALLAFPALPLLFAGRRMPEGFEDGAGWHAGQEFSPPEDSGIIMTSPRTARGMRDLAGSPSVGVSARALGTRGSGHLFSRQARPPHHWASSSAVPPKSGTRRAGPGGNLFNE